MIDSAPRAFLRRCEGIQLPDGVGDARFSAACLLLHTGHAGVGQLHLHMIHLHCMNVSPSGLPSLQLRSGFSGKRVPSSVLLPTGIPACSRL
jgi:hypothetical protein